MAMWLFHPEAETVIILNFCMRIISGIIKNAMRHSSPYGFTVAVGLVKISQAFKMQGLQELAGRRTDLHPKGIY